MSNFENVIMAAAILNLLNFRLEVDVGRNKRHVHAGYDDFTLARRHC